MDITVVAVVIVAAVLIFFVRMAMRQAVSQAVDATIGPYADTHHWVAVAAALGMVLWAVLDVMGVTHEKPWRVVKHCVYGALSLVVLIAYGVAALKKGR